MVLAGFSALGQKRVYLNKGDTHEDIFVVNLGTEEEPDLELSIQMCLVSDSDSTFVVFKEKDFQDAFIYFRAVADAYDESLASARKNKIEDQKKPIDLYPPELRIRWTQHPKSERWSEWRQIKTYQTGITHELPIEFNITSGFAHVVGQFQVNDEIEPDVMGFIHFMLDKKSLNTILRWINPEVLSTEYRKKTK